MLDRHLWKEVLISQTRSFHGPYSARNFKFEIRLEIIFSKIAHRKTQICPSNHVLIK